VNTGTATHPYPNGTRPGEVGYIVFGVPEVERAKAFYGTVLGWTFSPGGGPDQCQVEHVAPHTGLSGGGAVGELSICWRVDAIDAAVGRVRNAGGTTRGPDERPYGLVADCADDQRAAFYLWQPRPEQAAAERSAGDDERPLHGVRNGDMSYLTLQVEDADRTRAFYGAVLGWQFHTNDDEDPDDTMPMIGIWGGCDRATGVAMYLVDDIGAAVARVRAAGGNAREPERKPYGLSADCTDDQGIAFYLGQP
jgi:uncharacterized protein